MLDLPEPLGPEMTVKPGSRGNEVVLPNDLNRVSSIRLMYITPHI
jgi:hypothetical protein